MQVIPDGFNLILKFAYNTRTIEEVKVAMNGRWNPQSKSWSVVDNARSRFVIDFLKTGTTYERWKKPVERVTPNRSCLYSYQVDMLSFVIARQRCILAAEMGVGKTLVSIEALEQLGGEWWYVAPKSALLSVKMDYRKWKAKNIPRFLTYDELIKTVTSPFTAPYGVIFDESSKLKNFETKRTKAAFHLASHTTACVLMSGTPAPKSPVDWWSQCEITAPGFLREGNVHKFLDRLAVVVREENSSGVKYPKILGFKDSIEKCNICAKPESAAIHSCDEFDKLNGNTGDDFHTFVACNNEVEKLYRRMKGLVDVKLKKDCLDLPDKVYQIIRLPVSAKMKALAKAVVKSARGAAQALINLRELSDGFQYHDKAIGTSPCMECDSKGCIHCSNKGYKTEFQRVAVEIDTPKDEAFLDILDSRSEKGRLIVYAGFTSSIDKLTKLVSSYGKTPNEKWDYIRVDGSGWSSSFTRDSEAMIEAFQSGEGKICFIGHPKSAGMGLTLTASDTTVYYSNDFDGESRTQSEDRNWRIGTKGCNIIDLIHLPTDELVLTTLKRKRKLELITLGEIDVDKEHPDE